MISARHAQYGLLIYIYVLMAAALLPSSCAVRQWNKLGGRGRRAPWLPWRFYVLYLVGFKWGVTASSRQPSSAALCERVVPDVHRQAVGITLTGSINKICGSRCCTSSLPMIRRRSASGSSMHPTCSLSARCATVWTAATAMERRPASTGFLPTIPTTGPDLHGRMAAFGGHGGRKEQSSLQIFRTYSVCCSGCAAALSGCRPVMHIASPTTTMPGTLCRSSSWRPPAAKQPQFMNSVYGTKKSSSHDHDDGGCRQQLHHELLPSSGGAPSARFHAFLRAGAGVYRCVPSTLTQDDRDACASRVWRSTPLH